MTQANITRKPEELTLQQFLQSDVMQKKLATASNKLINAEQLIQAVLFQVARNADLQRCSQKSIVDCVAIAAEYGWMIGGPRPGMYMVPYGNVATPIPSYFGFQQTARETLGEWELEADVVREGDHFIFRKGTSPMLDHVPASSAKPITHAYAIAREKNGRFKFDVMDVAAVDAIRARSRASQKGPWATDYAEMAKKTVVRRLCKYLPSSPAFDKVLMMADAEVDLDSQAAAPTPNASYARAKKAAGEVFVDPMTPQGLPQRTEAKQAAPQTGRGPAHTGAVPDAPGGATTSAQAAPPNPSFPTPHEGPGASSTDAPSPSGKINKCGNCGFAIPDSAKFCPECGGGITPPVQEQAEAGGVSDADSGVREIDPEPTAPPASDDALPTDQNALVEMCKEIAATDPTGMAAARDHLKLTKLVFSKIPAEKLADLILEYRRIKSLPQ